MSKDPRDGLKLRLGYEVAREIERTPIISLGVQDAAVKAINSVLYQRLQDQIVDDNPTAQILEERIRDINITNIACICVDHLKGLSSVGETGFHGGYCPWRRWVVSGRQIIRWYMCVLRRRDIPEGFWTRHIVVTQDARSGTQHAFTPTDSKVNI